MDGIFKSTETINLSSSGVTELEGSQLESPNNSFSSISSNPSRSRYGRTCKPKTSTDYCNIDEIFEEAKTKKQTSPKRTKVVSKIVSDSANSVKNSRSKSKTNKKSFMHVTGDSDFKISVNNVKCSRSPNKVNKKYKTEKVKLDNLKITKDDQTIKKSIQTETVCESETEQLDENLSDNVSKALKIVSSKPSFTENDVSPDQKSNKPTLKTYSNKRKFTPKKQVVESFGLPDLPIFPVEEKPLEVKPKKEDFKFEEETKEDQEMTVVNKICTKSSQDEGKVNKEIEITEKQKNENLIQKLEDESGCIESPKLTFSGDKNNSSNQSHECEKSQKDECGMNEKITQEVNVTCSEQESTCVSNDTIKSIKLPDNSPKANHNLPDSKQESQSSFQVMKLEDLYNIESKRRLIVELSNDLNLSVALNKGKLNKGNLKKESPSKTQKSPMKKLKSEILKSPVTLRKSTRRNSPNSQTPKAENQETPSLVKVTEDKLNHNLNNEKIDKEKEIVLESSTVISPKVLRSSKQFKTNDNIKSEISSEDSKIQNLEVENNVSATEVLNSEISNKNNSSEEQEMKETKIKTTTNNIKPDSEPKEEEIDVAKSSVPKEEEIEEKIPTSAPQLRRSPIKRLQIQTNSSSKAIRSPSPKVKRSPSPKVKRSPSPNKLPLVIENDYLQEIEKYSSLYCAHKKQKVKKRSALKKLGSSDKINNVKSKPNRKIKSFLQEPEIQQVIDVKNLPDNESKKDNTENKEKKKVPPNTTPSVVNLTSKKEKKRTLRSSANFIHTSPENKIIKTEIVKVAVKKSKENFPQSSSQEQPVELVNEDTSQSLPNEDKVEEKQTSEEYNIKIGDLIWSRVGSYPYWPSMVCAEPDSEFFKKTFVSRTAQLFYHVKFFGDKGRRSWINHKNIIPYHKRNDLEVLLKRDKLKPENKYSAQRTKLYQIYRAAKYILPKWKRAVDEIDSLKPKTVRERLQFFEEVALKFAKPKTKIKKKEQDKKSNSLSDENKIEKPENVEENDEIKLKELVQEKVEKSEEKNQNELVQVNHKKDEENKELEQEKLKKDDEKKGEELVQEAVLNDGHFSRKLRKRASEKVTPSKTPTNNNDSPSYRMLRSQASSAEETITKTEVAKREKDSKSCKYNVTESISFNNFVNKNIKSFKENKPELDDKNVEKNLKELWNNLSVREKRVYGFISDLTSEYSDSDTHSSSKGSTFSAIPNSMEEQIKLYKRNSLFKGVNRQRVCNNCEKPNGVFKCKGPCNGSYHPECTQVPIADFKQEIEIKTENLQDNSESILEKDQQIVSSSLHSEKTDPAPEITTDPNPQETKNEETYDPNKQIKVEKDDECYIDQNNSLNFENVSIDDSRVEIISVYSDDSDVELSEVTNLDTTSRKLSLFEQIDLKMKEVMSKRGDKTTYADSTTDFSSENSTTESEETPKPIEKNDDPVEIQKNPDEIPFDQENFKCSYCSREIDPPCFVCGLETSVKNVSRRIKCSLYKCGKFYHVDCLKIWPQTQWSLINSSKSKNQIDKQFDSFVCPCHVCHTCVSDDPRVAISRCSSDKVVKCLRCPATYHTSNLCVPAGTSILSSSQILCPRHRTRTRNSNKLPRNSQTINTTWCFICSQGGNLICCETCPTSVHPDCLKVNLMDDGTFVCEDCESGRFPLYDEIVWAKLGSFRWWPAIILFPNEVPDNVANLPHRQGEFVVRFFGSHDHYWVNSGRVFLFQEEDQGGRSHLKRKIDQLFNKSIDEAVAAYRLKKKFKSQKESEVKDGLKPPPYIKIKANKPVGSVKMSDGNTSNTTACECDPKEPFPCGPDTDCINRLLMTECNPDICPAGDRCYNQRFEKRQYAPLEPYRTESRGWGLRSLAPIRRGDFVIEYVGELIDDREYQRRMNRMHETKDENYYFLTVDKDRIIDAGPKGNLARFMNHSCQPNCETQKWTVNGDTKVGLFALDDIPTKTELTFNYNLECVGKEKKVCKCGAETCSGFIGGKSKENAKRLKKKDSLTRRKTAPSPTPLPANENACFVCGEMGEVRGCCYKVCNKFYHLKCVSLQYWPEGNKWFCPSHNCNTCGKRTIRCCYKCINSYCPSHAEGNVRYDNMLGFVCSDHDPAKASQEPLQKYPPKKKSRMAATKETDITSTTDDVLDSTSTTTTTKENNGQTNCEETLNEDLLKEYEDVNSAKSSENFVGFDRATSTPLKTLKSTTVDTEKTEDEEEEQKADKSSSKNNSKKRKRGKLRKQFRGNKRIKLEENDASKRNLNVPQLLNNVSVQNEVKLSSTVPERHLRTVRNSLNSSTSDRFFKHQSELEKDLPIRKRTRLRCEVNAD